MRASNSDPVAFTLRGEEVAGPRLDGWREALRRRPEGTGLSEVLDSDQLTVMFVEDRGTTGLAGPTRADRLDGDPGKDFVDFIRNVGQPRDKLHGGGTYGFGKSIFYLTSSASTIVVYTRTRYHGRLESRLMGAALGGNFRVGQVPHTGRHWWGATRDGVIEPILGEEADRVASRLGFDGFANDETGTGIAIVGLESADEDGESRSGHRIMEIAAEAIAWNCWPKYGLLGHRDQIRFRVSWNGGDVPTPDTEIPVLKAYRRALAQVLAARRDGAGDDVYSIDSQRPVQHLGLLALEPEMRHRVGPITYVSPFGDGPSHHVALMREPRLVVKYEPGPLPASGDIEWGGVFLTATEVDDAFAKSEPPTHDDWVSSFLERPEKVFVNVALRNIRAKVGDILNPRLVEQPGGDTAPLGALSARLGSLILNAPGTGGRGPGKGPGARPVRRKGIVEILEQTLVERRGVRMLNVRFRAEPRSSSAQVQAIPKVVLDGGSESDAPQGAPKPELLELILDGQPARSGANITGLVEGAVLVSVPNDTMVAVDINLVEENDGES